MFDLVHLVPVVPVCQSVQDILRCFGVVKKMTMYSDLLRGT